MATQPLPPDDEELRTASLSHVPAHAGAPIEALVAGTVGDRCVNCGAPLSSDQRYCVVCGERRGAPRFSLPATAVVEETVTSSAPPPKPPRRARLGSGTTLVAGVATLLLAVLVGVLIGHGSASNGAKTVAGPTKIIKINSGVAPAAPASSGSTVASGSGASTSVGSSSKGGGSNGGFKKGGSSKSAAKKPPVDKKAAAAQQQAASKVLGGSNNAPPTVTVGQKAAKGTPGVNKKTGKFDGSFFGG
jgi:hypothetical protein